MKKEIGILFGYGSIGRRHAKALSSLTSSLVVVDMKDAARTQAKSEFPNATIVESLKAYGGDGISWDNVLPIIATWGPSHEGILKELAERGVRHVLCEKPMASSVQSASRMLDLVGKNGISMSVNHYIRYSHFVKSMNAFSKEKGLGDPVSIVVTGGAACLVTSGIHWIDFACELLNSDPIRVISTAQGENINPRSPDLQYFGGSAIWTFKDGREMTISFSNKSSLAPDVRVIYRNAVFTIDNQLNVDVRGRDLAMVEKFPSVTRTGPTPEILFKGRLPGVLSLEEGLKAAGEDALKQEDKLCTGAMAHRAVSACIGALISAREKRGIDLPIDPDSEWGKEDWPIS